METLFKDIPKKEIVSGIGSRYTYVNRSLGTLAENNAFIKVYDGLHSKRTRMKKMVDQMVDPTKEKGKEKKN